MSAYEMTLLFDHYGGMLTEKQRDCFDMRYNQDLSLSEIGEELGISRQAVCDSLGRTEALLRRMEENIGSVQRDQVIRSAAADILAALATLDGSTDPRVRDAAQRIQSAVYRMKE